MQKRHESMRLQSSPQGNRYIVIRARAPRKYEEEIRRGRKPVKYRRILSDIVAVDKRKKTQQTRVSDV